MPIQVDGVLLRAMSGSELSRVRTELDPLRILPTVSPHPVQPNRESSGHAHLGDVPLSTHRQAHMADGDQTTGQRRHQFGQFSRRIGAGGCGLWEEDSSAGHLLPPLKFVTQIFAPSKATFDGPLPVTKVPSFVPLSLSFVSVLLPKSDTQMLAPSKATPKGLVPAANVPRTDPSLARNLVTVLLFSSATQMFVPSKAMPLGLVPTPKVPIVEPLSFNSVTVLLENFHFPFSFYFQFKSFSQKAKCRRSNRLG
jgi:hypothetical protein